MALEVVLPEEDQNYLPYSPIEIYLEEAFEKQYGFIVINSFDIREDNISIDSSAFRGDNGDRVFNLTSSGSMSLGLQRKINFIIGKINEQLIAVEKEIEEEKNLFLSIFGETEPQSIPELKVPLFINGSFFSSIRIIPPANDDLKVHAESLIAILKPILLEEMTDILIDSTGDEDFISIENIQSRGIKSEYDEALLNLYLTIPTDQLKLNDFGLIKGSSAFKGVTAEQSPFSFYLNLLHDQQWMWDTSGTEIRHQFPGRLAFDSSVNYRDWIFSADYNLNYPEFDELPAFTISHDFRAISSRLTAGNFPLNSWGYQSFGYYQGLSFSRIPEIEEEPAESNALYEFTLDSPSYVQVFLNGTLVKAESLNTGRYNLTDFSYGAGVNEVLLVIENSFGHREEIEMKVPFASRGLKKGDFSYDLSVGVPPYSLDLPLATGNLLFGVSRFLTAGINIQSDFKSELAGLTLIVPTSLGTFDLEAAQSWSPDRGFGASASLSYNFTSIKNSRIPSFSLWGQVNSPAFHTIGSEDESVPPVGQIKTSLSWNLADFMQVSPRGSVRFDRDGRTGGALSLGLIQSISQSLSARLNFNADFPPEEDPAFSAALFVQIKDEARDQSLTVKSDTNYAGADVSWNRTLPDANHTSFSAGLSGLPLSPDSGSALYARARSSFNRFTGSLSSSFYNYDNGEKSFLAYSRLGSSLVYADKHFAISRPVNDSFAIIVPRFNLEGMDIGVNPRGDGYVSRSDFTGHPVINNLRSYHARQVSVHVTEPDVDIDTELGTSVYTLFPRYKSGTVIYAGTRYNVYITGRLVDQSGSPLPFETGFLTDKEGESQLFFTDREGIFYVYGLQRGECELELNNKPFKFEFLIPEDTEKKMDLGDLKIQ